MEQQTEPGRPGGPGGEAPAGSAGGLAWLQSFAGAGEDLAGDSGPPEAPGRAGAPGGDASDAPQDAAGTDDASSDDAGLAGPAQRAAGTGGARPAGAGLTSGEQAAAGHAEAAYAAVSRAAAAPVPGTGEPRVDAALQLLERLPGLPVSDHPELFEQVHAQLAEVLGELESGPRGPAGS